MSYTKAVIRGRRQEWFDVDLYVVEPYELDDETIQAQKHVKELSATYIQVGDFRFEPASEKLTNATIVGDLEVETSDEAGGQVFISGDIEEVKL